MKKNSLFLIIILLSIFLILSCTDTGANPDTNSGTESPSASDNEDGTTDTAETDDTDNSTAAPVITAFTLPDGNLTGNGTIEINIVDDGTASAWMISLTASAPSSESTNWLTSAPEEFSLSAPGQYELYAWVKNSESTVSTGSGPLNVEYVDGPKAGEIIITEIMADPNEVSDPDGEWFEIYNTSDRVIDLHGCKIQDSGTDNFYINNTLNISAGEYLVFACSDAATSKLPVVDYVYSGLLLSNSSDELFFSSIESLEIDKVGYTSLITGKSIQLLPEVFDSINNDIEAYWTDSTSIVGNGNTDMGTPRAANDGIGTATINFYSDFNEEITGSLTVGSTIIFDYDISRLPEGRATDAEGANAWNIAIHYIIPPSSEIGEYILPVGAASGNTPAPVFVPAGSTQIEVWAHNYDIAGCSKYDNNMGNNYCFNISN